MAAVTIYRVLEPKKLKSFTLSTVSPSISHEVMGPDAMIFVFWMLSFKSTFSLSPFSVTKRLFSSSSLVAQRLKRLTATQETWVRSLCWEDPLEKEMATHSSTLAWRIPWTEEPGGLQSTGSQRVGHDWATSLTHSFLNCENSWISLENVEDLLKKIVSKYHSFSFNFLLCSLTYILTCTYQWMILLILLQLLYIALPTVLKS